MEKVEDNHLDLLCKLGPLAIRAKSIKPDTCGHDKNTMLSSLDPGQSQLTAGLNCPGLKLVVSISLVSTSRISISRVSIRRDSVSHEPNFFNVLSTQTRNILLTNIGQVILN